VSTSKQNEDCGGLDDDRIIVHHRKSLTNDLDDDDYPI